MKRNRIKFFIVATMVAVLSINNAYGMSVEDAMADKPLDKPTLDQLNDEVSSSTYPRSGYNYVEQSASSGTSVAKQTSKTIATYYSTQTGAELNDITGLLEGIDYITVWSTQTTPHYYNVALNKIEYGSGPSSDTIDFSSGILDGQSITIKYDDTTSEPRKMPGDITGDLSGNWYNQGLVDSSSDVQGGAILKANTLDININGSFYKNKVEGKSAQGGAVYNVFAGSGSIDKLNADFIQNTATATANSKDAQGGAIMNSYPTTINEITGDFIENVASSQKGNAYGGAIANNSSATIGKITGDFVGNKAEVSGTSKSAQGGAIYNSGNTSIGEINGNFVENSVNSSGGDAQGGAIYSFGSAKLGEIKGDFISNHADGKKSEGGAICVGSSVGTPNITGDFVGNYAKASTGDAQGGAINVSANTNISNLTGDFVGNYAKASTGDAQGGAINVFNSSNISNITGDFAGNVASSQNGSAYGGAIFTSGGSRINTITGGFIGNGVKAENEAFGGVLSSTLSSGSGVDTFYNSSFINNYAESTNGIAKGGAIYITNGGISPKFVADNYTSVFEGNYSKSIGEDKKNIAIYMDNQSQDLNFDMRNGGKFVMKDILAGEVRADDWIPANKYYILTTCIKGDDKDKTTYYMLNDNIGNLTLDNTTINTINNQIHTYNVGSMKIENDINFVGDVDLANKEMDRFKADTYKKSPSDTKINVTGFNLISDSDEEETEIKFAEKATNDTYWDYITDSEAPDDSTLVDKVVNQTGDLYTPIYKYKADYDDATGNFLFKRTGSGGGDSGAFNPAVLATSVTAAAGATATMSQTFNNVFHHSDMFMNLPSFDRVSVLNSNKYALLDSIKDGYYSTPLLSGAVSTQGAWIRPYTSFENIPLNNGPNVRNITYGTLIGFDSNLDTLNNGWSRVFSGYVGYNGATQKYNDISTYQNGGLLGGTLTMYKGNFFNATTLAVGASVAENNTMYGRDNFTMLLAGLGNKTGYNIEFKDGKFIAQPNLFMGYTFVNTFDYTNAAGVNIHANPLNSLQIAPGIKFIGNLDGGWQPYASVSMVWDTMGKSTGKANDVRLPEMYIKPYVQYGVGLQKRFNDNCVAYGQAMIQNGGRNGISLTAGFRWALKNLFGIESI